MAIVPLHLPTEKGTKLCVDINCHPLRKRFSPGLLLKKGKEHAEENQAKKDRFRQIVNEWDWLLLNASQEEIEKVYNLKAGKKTKDKYKAISLKDILSKVRFDTNPNSEGGNLQQPGGMPTSIAGAIAGQVQPGLDEIDFFAFYDRQHIGRKKHEVYDTIKKKVRDFHSSIGPLAMKNITKQWMKDFISYLRGKMSENTSTLYFSHVRTILQEAVEQEIIPFNPGWLVAKKERPKLKRSDADSLTFEEIQVLVNVERPRIPREGQLMFLFSCFTGLRVSDCTTLKWNQIYSFEEAGVMKHRIRLKQIKTQARINKPLSESALTIFEQRKSDAEESGIKSPYVFPSYCPDNLSPESARGRINQQLKRWAKEAELDHRLHFHLARHTYATLLLEQGNDITVVQQLLGHKDIRATMIYAHVSTRLKENAVNTLPKINADLLDAKPFSPYPKRKRSKAPSKDKK